MAEKAVKGYLAFHKVRFPKTHDLEILILLVAKKEKVLSEELAPAVILTDYAVAYRYPEEKEPPEPLTLANCERLVSLADDIFRKLADLVNQ